MKAPLWFRKGGKRRLVYDLVRAAGAHGVFRRQLVQWAPELAVRDMDNVLRALLLDDLVLRLGQGHYGWTPACQALPDESANDGLLVAPLLAEIGDCPGGVSELVLAGAVQVPGTVVRRALAPLMLRGDVLPLRMPGTHGGGMGYRLADEAASGVALPAAAPVGGLYRLLPDGRLELGWAEPGRGGEVRLMLPPGVTRGLFAYLDGLAGVGLTEQLPAEAPCA